jgi:putative flippase GtrA
MKKETKELISYLIFGVLTTLVSIVTYEIANIILGTDLYLISNIISWVTAVSFAYVTNKLWVFESKSWQFSVIKTEIAAFVIARLFSLGLEEAGLYLLIDVANLKEFSAAILGFTLTGALLSKLIMQVIVVIANYVFSKFIIFKKK